MQDKIEKLWYTKEQNTVAFGLKILSFIYLGLLWLKKRLAKPYKSKIPVIVVGNITVGGTGKTPMVIYLTKLLQQNNYKVAVISRGYKGSYQENFREVYQSSSYLEIGDEPLLIKRETGATVVVAKNRADALQFLESICDVDVIISDDGLQNYGFAYDISVVMVDGKRMFGNQQLLPAGPLREPLEDIKKYDLTVINGDYQHPNALNVHLQPLYFINNKTGKKASLNCFKEANLLAGIGNPQRFIDEIKKLDIKIKNTYIAPDHKLYTGDINISYPLLTTAKDALKYPIPMWYLEVEYENNEALNSFILNKLKQC
jgi:tetraacyldisaccharide 4'-kinase